MKSRVGDFMYYYNDFCLVKEKIGDGYNVLVFNKYHIRVWYYKLDQDPKVILSLNN